MELYIYTYQCVGKTKIKADTFKLKNGFKCDAIGKYRLTHLVLI